MKHITRFQRNSRNAGGAVQNPPAALVFCRPQPVDWSLVNGVPSVRADQPACRDRSGWVGGSSQLRSEQPGGAVRD